MILPNSFPARARFSAALCIAISLLAGCSSEGDRKLPGVYRVDVQQGNVIEQEMIDKLRPGMDRNQVRFIMGTPAIADPFHADRWDYVFTVSKGGRTRQQRHVTLYFKDDKLTRVEGDVVPGERKSAEETAPRSASVDVPLERNKRGVFSRMFSALPFVGDDDAPKQRRKREPEQDESGASGAEPEADTGMAQDDGGAVGAEPETDAGMAQDDGGAVGAEPETDAGTAQDDSGAVGAEPETDAGTAQDGSASEPEPDADLPSP